MTDINRRKILKMGLLTAFAMRVKGDGIDSPSETSTPPADPIPPFVLENPSVRAKLLALSYLKDDLAKQIEQGTDIQNVDADLLGIIRGDKEIFNRFFPDLKTETNQFILDVVYSAGQQFTGYLHDTRSLRILDDVHIDVTNSVITAYRREKDGSWSKAGFSAPEDMHVSEQTAFKHAKTRPTDDRIPPSPPPMVRT